MPHRPLLSALLLVHFLAGVARSEPVVLWKGEPPPPGRSLREDLTLDLDVGTFSVAIGEKALTGTAKAHIHDVFLRTSQSPTGQTAHVEVSTNNIVLGFGKMDFPKDKEGSLQGHDIEGQKEDGHWKFALAQKGKPTGAQTKSLKQFAAYVEIMEALGWLYGTTPRQVGDTWKPDLGSLKKTPASLDADLECKLEEIQLLKDDHIARITLHGHLEGTLGETGKVSLQITGTILRSLRDGVDLDMDLTGAFDYTGRLGKESGPSTRIKAPLRVKRIVKVVKPGE